MIKTLLIDDEPIALEKMKNYLSRVPFFELAGSCRSGLEAIDFLASNPVDLILTDIQMPDMNGLEFVKSLSAAPMVVFTTAFQEYALESYRVSAVDYLLKPYSFADFQKMAVKVREKFMRERGQNRSETDEIAAKPENSIFVKADHRYIRIEATDIRFIKSYGEYLQIYVKGNDQPLLTLSSFPAILLRLSDNFIQVHRSYVVNINNVKHVERGRIVMEEGQSVPIGDNYRTELLQYLGTRSVGKNKS